MCDKVDVLNSTALRNFHCVSCKVSFWNLEYFFVPLLCKDMVDLFVWWKGLKWFWIWMKKENGSSFSNPKLHQDEIQSIDVGKNPKREHYFFSCTSTGFAARYHTFVYINHHHKLMCCLNQLFFNCDGKFSYHFTSAVLLFLCGLRRADPRNDHWAVSWSYSSEATQLQFVNF